MTTAISSATSATTGTTATSSSGSSNSTMSMNPAESQDRFLKLLVAQLNNQDPMNPMDNAQMTTQLAQINTVSGIQELNKTVQGLVSQFSAMQTLQGASMVGHEVLTEGNTLAINEGKGQGSIDLSGSASAVTVEVLNGSGTVVDTVKLGAKEAGRYPFEVDASKFPSGSYSFRVTAQNGSTAVEATPLMRAKVTSVSSDSNGLRLDLASGKSLSYSAVKGVL